MESSERETGSLTILVVEDEALIAMELVDTLVGHGWKVIGPAASVADAIDLLSDGLPDVALLDIQLRDQLVTPLAELLWQKDVPFVLASSHRASELSDAGVLTLAPNVGKPVDERRLLAALAQVLKYTGRYVWERNQVAFPP